MKSPAIRTIDHINLVVRDLEESVLFYCDLLGFQETQRAWLEGEWIETIVGLQGVKAQVAFIEAPEGGPRLELLQYHEPLGKSFAENSLASTLGLRHIAFRVADIESLASHLKSQGVQLLSPPVRVPLQVVSHDAGEKSLLYFLDPNGILLELSQYT